MFISAEVNIATYAVMLILSVGSVKQLMQSELLGFWTFSIRPVF
jgi:hypothetical protein